MGFSAWRSKLRVALPYRRRITVLQYIDSNDWLAQAKNYVKIDRNMGKLTLALIKGALV